MIRSRPVQAGVLAALAVVAAVSAADAAVRYDPRLRFRTISTPRFDIHFHQGEEGLARRLAGFVEAEAAEVDRSVGAPIGRVQIVLVDQSDLSNGWATPLPYNTIELSAAAPPAESSIGNTDDWLRLVFVHEYTHIAHLSRASGWIGGLRRGFGRLPLLFPNLYQPVWGIEGIATWRESESTRQGRVRAGDFRQWITRAAAADRFEPIDRASGGNLDWPSGAGPYAYGAYFHQFLAERHGAESIRRLTDETSRRLPYLASRAYEKVYGQSLGELWNAFEARTRELATQADTGRSRAVRLTHHGFTVSGPRYAGDGRIFYSAISPHDFPALREVRPGSDSRHVMQRYLGNTIGVFGARLVVDEIDIVRNVALGSDLYQIDPRTGTRSRLTRGARAGDPDVSREGIVVCTLQAAESRSLATFRLPQPGGVATPDVLASEPGTTFAAPRWSHDGRFVAAERRQLGGAAQIVVIEVSTRKLRVVADLAGGRSGAPTWTRDDRSILFSSAVGGDPFRIYAADVDGTRVARLEGTGASAQSPDVSPDGQSVVFVGYTPDGYDLFTIPLAEAAWTTVAPESARPAAPRETPERRDPAVTTETRAYSPWPTLVPRFWTPTLESDGDELVVGAATGSVDTLGRHAYGIEGGWSTRARPDWQIAYAYDRWLPTLFVATADDTDPWRDGEVRTRELDAGGLWRLTRVRFSHTALAAFHLSRDQFECGSCSPESAAVTRGSLRLGWEFSSAKTFGYSVSPERGGRVAATLEHTRRELAADGNGFASTVDARRYWPVGRRHAVVALRAAAAGSWGDREAERQFTVGGSGPQPAGLAFGHDAIALLRGFDNDDGGGPRAGVVNADFRAPLTRVGRGFGTVPLFVRSLHGAVFVDAGHAWTGRARRSDVRVSVGAELSMDAVVGYALPVTLTAGGAWRAHGAGEGRRFVAFARIGRAF